MQKPRRSIVPTVATVTTVCLSLFCFAVAVWLLLTADGAAWMGLALLGAGFMTLSNIPSARLLGSGLDKEAQGRALVAATNSWQNWIPLSIGFVLLSAAMGAKVAGVAGGLAAAAVVAASIGVFAVRWSRRTRRLLAHPEATSIGAGFWVDLIGIACLLVAWFSFAVYALFGAVGAVIAGLSLGLVALVALISFARTYRAWQATQG